METLYEVIGQLFEVWKEIFSVIWGIFTRLFIISLWVFAGIFILPCVFVANYFYPAWTDWSEDL